MELLKYILCDIMINPNEHPILNLIQFLFFRIKSFNHKPKIQRNTTPSIFK